MHEPASSSVLRQRESRAHREHSGPEIYLCISPCGDKFAERLRRRCDADNSTLFLSLSFISISFASSAKPPHRRVCLIDLGRPLSSSCKTHPICAPLTSLEAPRPAAAAAAKRLPSRGVDNAAFIREANRDAGYRISAPAPLGALIAQRLPFSAALLAS